MKAIDIKDLLNIKEAILNRVDKDLVKHGKETAHVACLIGEKLGYSKLKLNLLRIAALFHDIGAYKIEDMNDLKLFEMLDTERHSIFGYVIFNEIESLKHVAPAILYHHYSYENKDCCIEDIKIPEEAFLISIADRVSIFCNLFDYDAARVLKEISNISENMFKKEHLEILFKLIEEDNLIDVLKNNRYEEELIESLHDMNIDKNIIREYLIFLPLTIDFFSYQTSLHTVSVSAITSIICKRIKLNDLYEEKVEIGAYLHDLGKVCIPLNILEKEGKLTEKEFEVMKKHVSYTRDILNDANIDGELIEIACNHHEKLNGGGYSRGLVGDELSVGDRILSVSDILCALTSKRSYKEVFSKEKVLSILNSMVESNYIDKDIVEIVKINYDEILDNAQVVRLEYENKIKNMLDNYKYIYNSYRLNNKKNI